MKTNVDDLVDGATAAAEASLSGLDGQQPELALLVSCVGRKLVMKQRVEEEIEAIRHIFGADTKIAGFYSYGELARIIHERPKVPIFGTQVTVAPAARVVRAWR